KTIEESLPRGVVSSTIYEGANIVVYTTDREFLKSGDGKIKEVVGQIKKRIELRAEKDILLNQEETEKVIRQMVPEESEITQIIFDPQRSTVIIEVKKPGVAIGKFGATLKDIRNETM